MILSRRVLKTAIEESPNKILSCRLPARTFRWSLLYSWITSLFFEKRFHTCIHSCLRKSCIFQTSIAISHSLGSFYSNIRKFASACQDFKLWVSFFVIKGSNWSKLLKSKFLTACVYMSSKIKDKINHIKDFECFLRFGIHDWLFLLSGTFCTQ